MTSHANSTEDGRIQDFKVKVQSWLMEEGWKTGELISPDAKWLIGAEDEFGRKVAVGQRVNRADQIVIIGVIGIDDVHQKQLAQLSQKNRQEFFWDMAFALLGTGVDFSSIADPLERIEIGQRIYFDGLTKDEFVQRVSQVRNAILLVGWTMRRRFAEPPPERESIGFKVPPTTPRIS